MRVMKENLNDSGLPNQTRETEEKLKEANDCIKLGVGVGALGAGAAIVSGAVCPLCVFIAPALVGVGVVARYRENRKKKR